LLGWITAFSGLQAWGLLLGAVTVLGLVGIYASRDPSRPSLVFVGSYVFVFALLTWPILWIAVGYARYLLTGESLGS
jgi:hypothetical protein